MTKFVKSNWATDGNSMRLTMPLSKVDKENRLVSGFATLDNVDTQGDVVLAEASAKAFARARGNLREMHQSIAVGKIVDFKEDEFADVDPVTNKVKFYRGIFVTAYVSKGAADTWEKVLDGTLTGFSIGGSIIEASNEFVKEANGGKGAQVRFIKDYDLVELSLVDNPANQLANVFSISKSATGSVTVKGMAAETEIENVFYCKEHPTALKATVEATAQCIECNKEMENIGWFETGGDRAEKVRDVVTKFLGLAAEDAGEGGVEMPKINKKTTEDTNTVETVETGHEAGDPTEVPTPVQPADDAVDVDETDNEEVTEEEATDVEEVADEEEAISKKIDELHEAVKDSLEKSKSESAEQIATLEKKIDEISEKFVAKTSELEEKFSEFGEKLETAKSRLAAFEKSLEVINSSEAFKKSADLEESAEPVQKSKTTWNGAFSIDNVLR